MSEHDKPDENHPGAADSGPPDGKTRRSAVRLSTVYGGRVCQGGRAYPCVISDVSESGAKIRLKDASEKRAIIPDLPVQLIFDRLGEYKSLNGNLAWFGGEDPAMGIQFSDMEKRRHRVISTLMPNRWNLVKGAPPDREDKGGQ